MPTDAHGHINGSVDEFIVDTFTWAERLESMTHLMAQSTIDLDGDSAWVETYCVCLIRTRPEHPGEMPKDLLGNIRHVDLFERREGEWRIARRKLVHQPSRLDPIDVVVPLAQKAMLARD